MNFLLPKLVIKNLNNLIDKKYNGRFSQNVLSDNYKNATIGFLKGRRWGDLKDPLFNLYVSDAEKTHFRICLDRIELQNFLNGWAAGKKTIWVDGMSMELEKPKTIRIFDIAVEYRSKDKGDVKHLLRKWVAIGNKKWSLADYAHFGKDVTSDWNIPPYGEGSAIAAQPSSKFDWSIVHSTIAKHSKSRFEAGHFADAVEAAFKEINDVIKTEYLKIEKFEKDGDKLMKQIFSPENPKFKLADLDSESGKTIQQGYMEIFAGAMKGIRNPKAHKNLVIDEVDAWEKIVLASHLMKMWDNRVK